MTCKDKLQRLTERDNRLAHYFALFWSLGLRLGYLTTFGAKSDVIFLLSDPDLLLGRRNFARISRIFGDLTRDKQTDYRQTTATETEGSRTKCASPINVST